jgi:hypothetical protein
MVPIPVAGDSSKGVSPAVEWNGSTPHCSDSVNGISYEENIMVVKESGRRSRRVLVAVMIPFLALAVSVSHAQKANSDEDFDSYKLRVSAFFFYSNPSGDLQGSHDADMIDLEKDFNFNGYSTFTGKADWKFTTKITSTLWGATSIRRDRWFSRGTLRSRARPSMRARL